MRRIVEQCDAFQSGREVWSGRVERAECLREDRYMEMDSPRIRLKKSIGWLAIKISQ